MSLPAYIEERIRRPAPSAACVVPQSTPVVAFGNAQLAKAATLGLNPSRVEFLDDAGALLDGEARRLATHMSLGATDLAAASTSTVARVLEDCNAYFDRNPYRRWFDQLTPILTACGASYYDRSACHLDLVQWATDPTWGGLRPASLRKRLIADDARFLEQQLRNENIRVLLVNGAGTWRQLRRMAAGRLVITGQTQIEGLGYQPTTLIKGQLFGRVQLVAWSTNLQSSFGVTTALREALPTAVAALV